MGRLGWGAVAVDCAGSGGWLWLAFGRVKRRRQGQCRYLSLQRTDLRVRSQKRTFKSASGTWETGHTHDHVRDGDVCDQSRSITCAFGSLVHFPYYIRRGSGKPSCLYPRDRFVSDDFSTGTSTST